MRITKKVREWKVGESTQLGSVDPEFKQELIDKMIEQLTKLVPDAVTVTVSLDIDVMVVVPPLFAGKAAAPSPEKAGGR